MRTLEKIKIAGFKSIKKTEIELDSINVIIGANGSGKSNFISAFKLLERVVSENLQGHVGQQGGASRFLFHGKKVTQKIGMMFDFGQNAYGFNLVPAVEDTLIFGEEWDSYVQYPQGQVLGRGHKESVLRKEATAARTKIPGFVLSYVSSMTLYHFHDTSESASVKGQCPVDDNRFLRPDASNLAAFLFWMKDKFPQNYGRIIESVRLVAPFFRDFVLEPMKNAPSNIKLEWAHKDSEAYFDAYSLSDGTLRFICLMVLLLQPRGHSPSVILLDEPELGLHPFALQVLAETLRKTAQHTQIIMATQSVTLLNQFSAQDVIVAEHDGRESSFHRLEEDKLKDWIGKYSLGELWEMNVFGGKP